MKKIYVALIVLLSINQINAQQRVTNELLEEGKKIHKLDLDTKITEALDIDVSNFEEISDEVLFDQEFEVKETNDLIDLLETIVDAREDGLVSEHIWDNLGVGNIFKNRIFDDGRINTDDFIGELPTGNDRDTDLDVGSDFRGKNNRVGPGGNNSGDIMNPGGGIEQGGENGFKGAGGKDFNGGGGDGVFWGVNASHFSSKNSNGSSTTIFIHHHEEVSNDNGYSSSTDKQTFIRGDGSSTSRTVVTQTQSDGSSKTSVKTTTKDSEGNTTTTTTYTAKDSDGEVTEQKTTETEDKEKPDDDESWDPEDPDGSCYQTPPPSEEEMESAIYRAIAEHGFAGGRDDERTGQQDNTSSVNQLNPADIQNKEGYMENRKVGGKLNVNKISNEKVTNPGIKK